MILLCYIPVFRYNNKAAGLRSDQWRKLCDDLRESMIIDVVSIQRYIAAKELWRRSNSEPFYLQHFIHDKLGPPFGPYLVHSMQRAP